MTHTIGGIPGSGGSYYTGSSYYKDSQEQSQWGGGAMQALGLSDGPVNAEQLDMLFDGHVPDGNRIAKLKEGKWVSDPGRDFAFSAPKSVSILAQGPLREEIHASMMRATHKAMEYGETEFAATRITNSETGQRETIGDQKIIYALFLEDTSRADDPQLHVHGPMPNLALGQDGKFRALVNEKFYKNQILLGQVFRAELAKDLKAKGFHIEKTGKHGQFEIKNVDADVKDAFSKRRKDMLEKAGVDYQNPKRMQAINLITRGHKSNLSPNQLMPRWQAELNSLGASFKEITQKALSRKTSKIQETPNLKSIVTSTLNHKAETQRTFGKYEVLTSVMEKTYRHFTIDKVQTELDHQKEKGVLEQSKDGKHYALSKTLRREKEVIAQMHKGHLQSTPILGRQTALSRFKGTGLTKGQCAGAVAILSHRSRYLGLQGTAGTGKTHLLNKTLPMTQNMGIVAFNAALPLAKDQGFKLIGIAPTGAATDELEKTGKFDKTMTLQQYLLTPEGDRNTLLVVDESSMVSTDQMLSLMRFANDKEMHKVVLMGDTRQMGAVAAGTPFKDLQDKSMRTVKLNEVVRQSLPRHREAIQSLAIENIKEGFKKLAPEIKETDISKLECAAVNHWQALKDDKAPIIVQTNRQKTQINTQIKESLNLNKTGPQVSQSVYVNIHLSNEEKKFAANYEGATHIRFNRNYKKLGIKSGDILKVTNINQDQANITLTKGNKTIRFRPAIDATGKSSIEVYRAEKLSLHKDDRIRFTRAVKPKGIKNNDFGVVKSVSDGQITITLDKGKEKTFSSSDIAAHYMDHAWANTAHAFQGKTVDHAIVVMPSRKSPLTTLNSLYTGASRHRLSVAIITDNKARLQSSLEQALKLEKAQDRLFKDVKIKSGPKTHKDLSNPVVKEKTLVKEYATSKTTQRSEPSRGDFSR